jgi:hypothetical protein
MRMCERSIRVARKVSKKFGSLPTRPPPCHGVHHIFVLDMPVKRGVLRNGNESNKGEPNDEVIRERNP